MENDKIFTLITHDDGGKPQEKTISIKASTFFNRAFDECSHSRVIVDEDLWSVECQDCGEKLDPIRFLIKLAQNESQEEFRIQKLKNEYKRIIDILAVKTNTRCKHCGKITPINTETDIKKLGLLLRYTDTKKNRELNERVSKVRCIDNDEGIGRWKHEFYILREAGKKMIYVCKYCGEAIIEEEV
jgi:DNA-directed RNA polymerase subunit RPC12/RpoP